MNKKKLEQFRSLKYEIKQLKNEINNLPEAQDTVHGSMTEHPYIERTIVITGPDENKAARLRRKLECKCDQLQVSIDEMENWLDGVDDPEMRVILRLKYRDGMGDKEIGANMGYDRSSISRKIRDFFKKIEDTPNTPE